MIRDAWLPVGHSLPDGKHMQSVFDAGAEWQILECEGNVRALVVERALFDRWITSKLVAESCASQIEFGGRVFAAITSHPTHHLYCLANSSSPGTKTEAISFASAMRETRAVDAELSFKNGIYLERFSRILPLYDQATEADDGTILGVWLSGGLNVSVFPLQRFQRIVSWLNEDNLLEVVATAGLISNKDGAQRRVASGNNANSDADAPPAPSPPNAGLFKLAGRNVLETFFNEHVVEIVQNRAYYKTMGIESPGAIILEGPPGCGKTFAVEQLVKFLGWPLFSIEASSVASPYIHETSKKVADVFNKAMDQSPSIVVIDEMEAFLADRGFGAGSGHHRVEEMAEFLRRIPEAIQKGVLIIGMTNRLDMIDQAILRRGRFDHVILVDHADEVEIKALLVSMLDDLPRSDDIDIPSLARSLVGRPLSDVSYVIREGARLAARARKSSIDHESLIAALASTPVRDPDASTRRIGFI